MAQSSDEVVRQARKKRQQQILECSRRAAKKILTKLKSGRPSEATLTELIAGEFEELVRSEPAPPPGILAFSIQLACRYSAGDAGMSISCYRRPRRPHTN